MFIDAFLTAGLALAQAPAPAPLVIPQPVIGVPAKMMPVEQPPAPAPMPMGQPAPATQPAAPMVAAPAPGYVVDATAAAAPPKYLAEQLLEGTRFGDYMAERGMHLYGWTQMSWTYGSANESNFPQKFVDRAHEFLFNQNYIVFEKAIDTSKKEFQIGFRGDSIAPGSDARYTLQRGLFDGQVTNHHDLYPWDSPQYYAEFYMPNLIAEGTSVKVGRFYNPAGYESIMAINTPFVTRSYGFQYNAFTFTGLLATTYLSDAVSVHYGATVGADAFFDTPVNQLMFLGGIKIAPKDGNSSFAINTQITNPKYNDSQAFANYNTYEMVYTHKFDRLTFAVEASGSHMTDFPGTSGAAWWYGFAQYFGYAVNDNVAALSRVEVWRDDKGVRIGTPATITDVTLGLQWKPIESVILTPEVMYNYSKAAPFEGGKQTLFIGAINLILRW